MPIAIAASRHKGEEASKRSTVLTLLLSLDLSKNAFLLAHTAKRQRWVYEPVVDSGSRYWDAPVGMALVDRILSEEEGSAELGAKGPKRRPIQMMSSREADECATHGEVLRWSPTLNYVATGLPCCRLFSFYSGVLLHRTFLHPDDETKTKSQDVEETKSEYVEEDNTGSLSLGPAISET